ncbi:DKNYY domain-containing protein [Siccibacter colletis]|uniref:DKNYY domain-containing protein n=1 Tax=Siccibacter colletis TaxID=1505757 RepID=UPI003CF426EB
MKHHPLTLALITCSVTFACSQQALATSGVTAPWKTIDGKVVFQPNENTPPQPLTGADANAFAAIYTGGDINIAQSQGHFYCNDQTLPKGFNPDSATVNENFLFSNIGSFACCEKTAVTLNAETFHALAFPYYTDGKTVVTISGSLVEGADAASFTVLTQNQAKDKSHYFFNAGEDVTLPVIKSAHAFAPCYGWADVDGTLYYEGIKQPHADAATFRCFSFSNAADKHGFYSGEGKVLALFPKGVAPGQIRAIDEDVYTDGKHVWFVSVRGMLLEGLDAKHVKVDSVMGDIEVSDGAVTWQCPSMGIVGEPRCKKVMPEP